MSPFISEENSTNLELLLKLYVWLDQSLGQHPPQIIFKDDSNHYESHSTDESFLPSNNTSFVNNQVFNPILDSQPNFLVNTTNTFKPIPKSPTQHYSNIPITTEPSLQDNQESKKRKHNETFPFVCHTLESMKEEEERRKTQPKRPRGRPRKHSFEQKIQDTKRLKHE